MNFRDFKPEYDRILLYATTYERKYLKALGMGEKSVFVKYFDAEVINTITDNKLQTVKVLILYDPKFKGRIIMGKGWLYDV